MPKFTNLKGVAAPLDIQNIDTDMIIPKEYLKTIKRTWPCMAWTRARSPSSAPTPGEIIAAGRSARPASADNPVVAKEVAVDDFVLNRPEYRERARARWRRHEDSRSRATTSDAARRESTRRGRSSGWAYVPSSRRVCGHLSLEHMKNGMVPVTLTRDQVLELLKDAEELKEIERRVAAAIRECAHVLQLRHRPFPKNCH